jgi:ankyrin repeat protein
MCTLRLPCVRRDILIDHLPKNENETRRSIPRAGPRSAPSVTLSFMPTDGDDDGEKLWRCALHGDTETAARLLGSTNSSSSSEMVHYVGKNGWTPLHAAAAKGCVEIVELLLQHGTNPNAQATDTSRPLMIAANVGYTEVVRLLLRHSANPALKNADGYTALGLANQAGMDATAKILEGIKPL